MLVISDSIHFAEQFTGGKDWDQAFEAWPENLQQVLAKLFHHHQPVWSTSIQSNDWQFLLLSERAIHSQFDTLVEACLEGVEIPDRLVCHAGCGENFHGFKHRPWAALPGNIHLSLFFRPDAPIGGFGVPFILLGVVSVLQTIDSFPELRKKAGVKWVNDILIGSAKVCGVLVRVQTQGDQTTSAVLGIGLNVKSRPQSVTSAFVSSATCLADHADLGAGGSEGQVFQRLLKKLSQNYKLILSGRTGDLLEIYRSRSIIIGKEVILHEDRSDDRLQPLATGRVVEIGNQLELFLEGFDKPFVNGRIQFSGL
jgi:biotin-[acetyl-CoA-carboxylase] ligase BirA-like protein